MTFWSGRPGWLGKLGLFLLLAWLIVLILSVFHVMRSTPPSHDIMSQMEKENTQKLNEMIEEFGILKKQNEALANLLLSDNSRAARGDHLVAIRDKLDIQRIAEVSGPSFEYEEVRRKIKNNIQEFWYYVTSELKKVKKLADDFSMDKRSKDVDDSIKDIWEHKRELMLELDTLERVDGHSNWRVKEAKDLSDLVQRRFSHLQNPSDCSKAKKLTCSLNKGCGFGCQIHHITYCFLVAYGTERTLILKSKGWRYHKDGWESVFKPLSNTCLSTAGDSHSNWPGDSTKQVVALPIVDNVYPKPKYQPPSIPADLAPRIQKLHGHPIVWWVGQVLKFLMRPQDNIKKVMDYSKEKLGFERPIVGIHVRRTDKVGTEAAYHDIDEYMVKVDHYFNQLETEPPVRRVFIASDDPKVITNARKRYPRYDVIGDPAVAETASVSKRYSDSSLQGIIVDIHLLSLCDHLVCTFSSQVCRVAYELMQTYHVDAHDKFTSLDDVYYYGGQNPNPGVAILDHIPRRPGEIQLRVGDKIEVYGNHWDGYSKGRNMRTSVTGLFPSFKVKNPVAVVEFPKYPDVPIYNSGN
ncbi:alpha-(1,6)-fucosyltransferase [Diachasmimorpha longicaudata]|uniref:alpha-(1,6)-fucosyltransferase n=1 Tax=Diachasmimorpha longicaudata TaxID=58733 RepID=UPI0030B8C9E7